MSIKDFAEKIKPFYARIKGYFYEVKRSLKIKEDLFIALLIVLIGLTSFGLGKLSSLEKQKTPISITDSQSAVYNAISANTSNTNPANTTVNSTNVPTAVGKGIVFSSKSGTKYYYPWCSGANRVKEENRVWFNSIADAKSAGLTPAANCPGLK